MPAKPIAAGKSSFDLVDAKKLFDALDIGDETVILDVACGRGAYALALASRWPDITVHAVDLWREGLDLLRQAAAERPSVQTRLYYPPKDHTALAGGVVLLVEFKGAPVPHAVDADY